MPTSALHALTDASSAPSATATSASTFRRATRPGAARASRIFLEDAAKRVRGARRAHRQRRRDDPVRGTEDRPASRTPCATRSPACSASTRRASASRRRRRKASASSDAAKASPPWPAPPFSCPSDAPSPSCVHALTPATESRHQGARWLYDHEHCGGRHEPDDPHAGAQASGDRKHHRHCRNDGGPCLATRVRQLSRIVTRVYDDAMRPLGITASQYTLLAQLAARDAITAVEIGHELDIEKSTLSRNLKRLLALGHINMDPPAGRRGRGLHLTPKGQAVLKDAFPVWQDAQKRAFTVMGAESRNTLDTSAASGREACAGLKRRSGLTSRAVRGTISGSASGRCPPLPTRFMSTLFPADLDRTLRSRCSTDLQRHALLIATAESCTGGLLAGLLTEMPGASGMVERGFVTYSNACEDRHCSASATGSHRALRRRERGGRARHGRGRPGAHAGAYRRRRSPASPDRTAARRKSRSGSSMSASRRRASNNARAGMPLRRHRPLRRCAWPACARR